MDKENSISWRLDPYKNPLLGLGALCISLAGTMGVIFYAITFISEIDDLKGFLLLILFVISITWLILNVTFFQEYAKERLYEVNSVGINKSHGKKYTHYPWEAIEGWLTREESQNFMKLSESPKNKDEENAMMLIKNTTRTGIAVSKYFIPENTTLIVINLVGKKTAMLEVPNNPHKEIINLLNRYSKHLSLEEHYREYKTLK